LTRAVSEFDPLVANLSGLRLNDKFFFVVALILTVAVAVAIWQFRSLL